MRRVAAWACAFGLLAACGGDDDDADGVRPVVDEIAPAIDAVEAELGESPPYFEINATPQLVNLFVADVDAEPVTVTPYVYVGGELQAPGATSEVTGGTPFMADDVVADLDTVLRGVTDELPGSNVSVFAVFAGDDGRPRYGATVVSAEGGVLEVDLGADGSVLAVDPGG